MKKAIAILLLLAAVFVLPSCSVTVSSTTAPTSSGEPTAPPVTTPPVTTTPPTATEPPAPLPSDAECIRLLLSELEALSRLPLSGELSVEYPDGETPTEDHYYGVGALASGELSFSGIKNEATQFSLLLSQAGLLYNEAGEERPYTAAELLSRIPELALNLDRADRLLANAVHFLTAYATVVDARLAEQGIAADSADLLAVLDRVILLFTAVSAEVGYVPSAAAPSGSEGDPRVVFEMLLTVSPHEEGGYSVVFDLKPLLALLSELTSSAASRIDLPISVLVDEAFGEGSASDILMRLAVISGTDKVSALTTELEKLALTARMQMDDFYAIFAALISENLTVGITRDELKTIVRENRNKTVDSMIKRFAPEASYAALIESIAALLAKTPAQLYAEGKAEDAPSLSEQLAELAAFLADTGDRLALTLEAVATREYKPASLSLSLSLKGADFAAELALSAAVPQTEN